MTHIPKLLVAGLGNLPYPNTRHRYFTQSFFFEERVTEGSMRYSLGQLLIDELSWRTGIRMSPDRDGFSGESTVILGKTPLTLTLFKSSTSSYESNTRYKPTLHLQNTS
jgi:PTH1 family peptidyl-tRNA hydrolase